MYMFIIMYICVRRVSVSSITPDKNFPSLEIFPLFFGTQMKRQLTVPFKWVQSKDRHIRKQPCLLTKLHLRWTNKNGKQCQNLYIIHSIFVQQQQRDVVVVGWKFCFQFALYYQFAKHYSLL